MRKWSWFHMVFINRMAQFNLAICEISEKFGTTHELNFFFFFFFFFFPNIFIFFVGLKWCTSTKKKQVVQKDGERMMMKNLQNKTSSSSSYSIVQLFCCMQIALFANSMVMEWSCTFILCSFKRVQTLYLLLSPSKLKMATNFRLGTGDL
jgi:hypothetical protein